MTDFEQKLSAYKQQIDTAVDEYCKQAIEHTHNKFGELPTEAVKAYCDLLSRGGKRIRGTLTMHAYCMFGGENEDVVLQAAQAVEMLHAYILIIDDIQDRSEVRRGGPAVHTALKQLHEDRKLRDESLHFGESIALNAALFGVHEAMNMLTNLDVSAEQKLEAIRNVNRHFVSTAHGQTLDIFNEVRPGVSEDDVDNVLLWKTAFYTFANPLQLGAILAGVIDPKTHDRLKQFSMQAGRVYQITDDILGVFGDDEQTGKTAKDDIIEGKRTILTLKALELANEEDAVFLEKSLGNKGLTDEDFERCQHIIKQSGALKYAQETVHEAAEQAQKELENLNNFVDSAKLTFLKYLVLEVSQRHS